MTLEPDPVVSRPAAVRRRAVLDASLGGGLAGYVERIRAQHGVLISGDTVAGCVCLDVMCSKHLLIAWCDEMVASYEAKVQDLAVETVRVAAFAAQLRDARAEVERLDDENLRMVVLRGDDAEREERLTAELAAERAKVQRVEALCDEWDAPTRRRMHAYEWVALTRAVIGGARQ